MSYTDKQLSEASTKDIYANYFDDHQLKTGIEPKILGNHLFHFFSSKKTDFKNIKILDFGGGDGSISKYLGDKLKEHRCCENYTVDVFDLYECEQKIAGVNYLRSEAEIQNNTYDIVIASAVL